MKRPSLRRKVFDARRWGFLVSSQSQPKTHNSTTKQLIDSCRLISCLTFSSSRLLECVRCLLERTYVMSVFYVVYLKKSCALRCISDDVRCEVSEKRNLSRMHR